jgi:hypothetical protein
MTVIPSGRVRGRPVLGAFAGFFFGLFLATDLLLFSVFPLDSILVVLLPLAGLVLGVGLGCTVPGWCRQISLGDLG